MMDNVESKIESAIYLSNLFVTAGYVAINSESRNPSPSREDSDQNSETASVPTDSRRISFGERRPTDSRRTPFGERRSLITKTRADANQRSPRNHDQNLLDCFSGRRD